MKIQSLWRGFIARKRCVKMRETDIRQVGNSFNRESNKGVSFKDNERQGTTAKKQMTPEEKKADAEKKKKELAKTSKLKKKAADTIDSKMNAVVKPTKDKVNEKQLRMREEL